MFGFWIVMFRYLMGLSSLGKALFRQKEKEEEEEDDLHAIRRMLEEDRKRKEPSKPSSPYTDMTDEELRRRVEEAERSMKRMR